MKQFFSIPQPQIGQRGSKMGFQIKTARFRLNAPATPNNKKVQGEEYLQAEVEKNKAEAFRIRSEGLVNMANARKIDAEADQIKQQTEERRQAQAIAMGAAIREEKLLPEYEDASFEEAMEGLVERIETLKLLYGTEIEVSESSDNQILIDSPGLDTEGKED